MNILFAMQDAKFVQINGRMFVAGYSCDPDDALVADDIVLEASAADGELELTFDDVRDAVELGPDAYQLRSGVVLCFLRPPTIH
jgi:hypothetical protein